MEMVPCVIMSCVSFLFSHFTDKTISLMEEGKVTSSVVLLFCLIVQDKKTHIMSVKWTQFDHLFMKPHDVLVIPINRNFGQLMLESRIFVIFWVFLDMCFRHIALHSKINRGKYWSTFCKHNICQSQGEVFFSVDFQWYLKLEMDCVESFLSWR